MQNKVNLITYPDSLGRNLEELHFALKNKFGNAVVGVHILPYFPSSSDRGFSPTTHESVDPRFGNWKSIEKIANDFELTSDLMVNHISVKSDIFRDYLCDGKKSPYSDWFISSEKFSRRIVGEQRNHIEKNTLELIEKVMNAYRNYDFVLHKEGVNRFALKKIYRRRPESPFISFNVGNKKKRLWCTFSKDQIDLDIYSPGVRRMLEKVIVNLAKHGTKMIRLDAVGYCVKKRDTESFMIPETIEFIQWLAKIAHREGISVLPEIHHHFKIQFMLANAHGVDYVYDFALPILVLHTIFSKNSSRLKHWIKIRPHNQITTLDTHDGLGMIDVKGLLSEKQIEKTKNQIKKNGGNAMLLATGENSDNVDVYQMNSTYYCALGENDGKYLVARVIQFFVPGIPQVYYGGLLAERNDEKKLKKTGVGRDIMRHNYSLEEIDKEIERDVVQKLIKLMEFRNSHPSFDGKFEMKDSNDKTLVLSWKKENDFCKLNVDLEKCSAIIEHNFEGKGIEKFVVC